MKKKNLFWSMLAVMMMAVFCGMTTACSSDDDDDDGGSIIGTWTGVDGRETLTLTFKSGNTGTYVEKYEDYYSGTETEVGTFTYTPVSNSKGMIVMKVYDSYSGSSTDVFYYTIEGKTMYLFEHDYYDDLEWVLVKQ